MEQSEETIINWSVDYYTARSDQIMHIGVYTRKTRAISGILNVIKQNFIKAVSDASIDNFLQNDSRFINIKSTKWKHVKKILKTNMKNGIQVGSDIYVCKDPFGSDTYTVKMIITEGTF